MRVTFAVEFLGENHFQSYLAPAQDVSLDQQLQILAEQTACAGSGCTLSANAAASITCTPFARQNQGKHSLGRNKLVMAPRSVCCDHRVAAFATKHRTTLLGKDV